MRQYDLHDNMKQAFSVPPQTVGTTGTGRTGKPVDRAGYAQVEILVDYGVVTATNATFTVTVKEGDVTGTMTTVSAANLIGSAANASLGQAATRTSGVSKNVAKRIGYIGTKRYIEADIKSTVTAGAIIATKILLGSPVTAPVAT
jgi:hypothetical protein